MMPVDRYTKFILTIIALALIAIAVRSYSGRVSVGAEEMGAGCGYDLQHPCFVQGWGPGGTMPVANTRDLRLKVLVTNGSESAVPVIMRGPGR